MNAIVKVLMNRDGMEYAEAVECVREARERVLRDGEDPEIVLEEEFGLEPDYVFDLI